MAHTIFSRNCAHDVAHCKGLCEKFYHHGEAVVGQLSQAGLKTSGCQVEVDWDG